MGFFGTFVYAESQWAQDASTSSNGPYLRVDIHDSDFAQIDFRPSHVGTGRFYLGFEPAIYFEDPEASRPVDSDSEVRGFVAWVEQVAGAQVSSEQVLPLLADPRGGDPEDVFVEDTVIKLLALAGLPLPPQLQSDA